jgi:hypothetical protein
MRQLLKSVGLGPLMAVFRTSWHSFDCYGTVPAGQRSILELPAGPISIAFESGSKYSKGVEADLPNIVDMDGRQLPVELMGSFQGPSMTREEKRSPLVMRKRFATATIPADGDYAVTAGVNPVLIGTAGFSRKPRAISGNAVVGAAR